MTQNKKRLLRAVLRNDFSSFIAKTFYTINPGTEYIGNWHIDLIADYLEAVGNGKIKRLIINMPPRALKSVCISVAWPAWILGHNPAARIMTASYAQELSIKHSLDCRFICSADWYHKLFPKMLISNKHNRKNKFMTTQNGFRFATSVGGAATGEGGDFLIVDDPHNPTQINSDKFRNKAIEWFEQTFITRLNNKNTGAIVLVMQRLHHEDLAGYLINNGGWEVLSIPSIAPKDLTFTINDKSYYYKEGQLLNNIRDNMAQLNRLEQEIGAANFSAQYLQNPVANQISLLSKEDISFYQNIPDKFEYVVHSWDTAIKTSDSSDYSVCSVWGVLDTKYYLIALMREKLSYPALKTTIEKQAEKYKPRHILIEDKASGQSIIQDLRLAGYSNIVPIKPLQDKITRFASTVPLFQSGVVLLPKTTYKTKTMIDELVNFPNSKHDDIVDSFSQFLNFIKTSQKQSIRIRNIL